MELQNAERRMAELFFADALRHVESNSIRDWASNVSKHREAWLDAAEAHLRKHEGRGDAVGFATLIVCTAIGL